jgi:hypothetical protein
VKTVLALIFTLSLLGCSSAEPEENTPLQDRTAPEPREPDVPLEAPPLGSTRPKVAPSSVVEPTVRPN